MEKALFPLKYMRQTQGVNGEYSHQGTYAIDFGNRGTKENLHAPFTGVIKKIYTQSGNGVWLESVDKVLWADGTIDYMTVLTLHDDDVSNLKVGDKVNQGQVYYQQGTAGNATGVHVHIEVGKGKFTGTGWYKNNNGIWMINNAVHPATALFLPEDVLVVDDGGNKWRKIFGSPVGRDINKDQIEILINNLRCRKTANGEILGYINAGIYNIISKVQNSNYDWYQIEPNRWVAYDKNWAKIYLKEDSCSEVNKETIDKLNSEISLLRHENGLLKQKIEELEKKKEVKFSFICRKTDMYAIKLYKDEILYISVDE
jgi:hypothetical protein